jgi:uncharacterized protein (DUF3084 family)
MDDANKARFKKKYLEAIADIDEIIKQTRRLKHQLDKVKKDKSFAEATISQHPLYNDNTTLKNLIKEQKNLHKLLKQFL